MRKDTRITALVAIGTFTALSLISAFVWAMNKPPTTFERVSIDDIRSRIDDVVFIDVRASEAYVASHVKGALHIPLTHLQGELQYLPKGKTFVTYCSCPAEESSGEAALVLQKFGLEAVALLGGYDAWLQAGLPTAAGVK
ncbi:MAG TPA: rhodanese-like domain-containing protein [Thermoanaerobaculia bacterium]|nr:rhodanese-like domain-containing protein [Thermoanaerobaculia bacterium]